MNSIFRVLSYALKYPYLAGAQIFFAIGTTLLQLVFPEMTGRLIDDIIPNQQFNLFAPAVIIVILSFWGRDLLNGLRIWTNNYFEQIVIFDIRSSLYSKIQRFSLRWHHARRTGDIMTRMGEDVTSMERVLIDGIEQGLIVLVQIVVVGIVLFLTNAQVAVWATLPIPLLILGVWIYTRNAKQRYRSQREATSELNALLHDQIDGIEQIKIFSAEEREHRRFNVVSHKLRKANLKLMAFWAIYSPTMNFIAAIGYVLVLFVGGGSVMRGEMDYGQLVKFLLLLHLFYDPVGKLHQLNQMVLSSRASADRVFEILDDEEETEKETRKGEVFKWVQGEVKFDKVSFSYLREPVLKDISFNMRAGQLIALVGETGAGKSSLMALLPRFYHCTHGKITIDGKDIAEINKKQLRDAISYVTQESFLFNDTIRENLVLAKPEASDEELWKALTDAEANEFVARLPEKLDTSVGERGVKLSGGERQRIAIARALLKNAPILLLDEATASIDNRTEKKIQQALSHLEKGRTTLVIAHRLSTVRNADCIHVMKAGKIVESGSYQDLFKLDGEFTQLAKQLTQD